MSLGQRRDYPSGVAGLMGADDLTNLLLLLYPNTALGISYLCAFVEA